MAVDIADLERIEIGMVKHPGRACQETELSGDPLAEAP